MRWRSPSKPRCRFAKLVSNRHRVPRSLTGQEQPCRKVAESGRSLALSTHYSRSSVDFAALFLAKEKAWTASSGETS